MGFSEAFIQKLEPIKVRCIECFYMHQEEKTKNHYFCLKARDFIEHKLNKKIECRAYKPLTPKDTR